MNAHPRRWSILAVLVVSLLIVVLDNTVLNVALPTIQRELGASQSQQEWFLDGFTLAFAALLFPYGVLGDRWGRRRVLMFGMAVFGLASIASAYATSPTMLIWTRVAMGVGGAAVLPATLAIITNVFPAEERGRAIGVWAGAAGAAVAIGPLIGGSLLDSGFWWGSVFLINVPVVVIGLAGTALLVPESRDPEPEGRDIGGILLAGLGLCLLVYGLIRAGETSEWTRPSVLATMIGGVAVLAVFVILEARNRRAALDVGWFRNRSFSTAVSAITLVSFGLFGILLSGAYYLQFDQGYRPLHAGALLLPLAIGMGITAPLSARFVRLFGERIVISSGLLLVAVAFGCFYFIGHTTPVFWLEAVLSLLGLGMGAAMAPTTNAVLASLPRDRAGAGSAVNNTVRQVGGALGIAVMGSLLSTIYRDHIASALTFLPEQFRGPAGESIGATQIAADRLAPLLPDGGQALRQQASDAFVHAMHVTNIVSAVTMLVAVAVVLIFMPRGAVAAAAAAPTLEAVES